MNKQTKKTKKQKYKKNTAGEYVVYTDAPYSFSFAFSSSQ